MEPAAAVGAQCCVLLHVGSSPALTSGPDPLDFFTQAEQGIGLKWEKGHRLKMGRIARRSKGLSFTS